MTIDIPYSFRHQDAIFEGVSSPPRPCYQLACQVTCLDGKKGGMIAGNLAYFRVEINRVLRRWALQGGESSSRLFEVPSTTGERVARGAAILLGIRAILHVGGLAQSIVVARCVAPSDVGTYALALAIITIAARAKQVGSVQKVVRDPDPELGQSFSAALAVQFSLATIAFFLLAGFLWLFDGHHQPDPRFALVTVALGVTLFQQPAELPGILLCRRLEFGAIGVRQISASGAGISATIGLAIAGFGIWSLVIGQMVGVAASALVFWRSVPVAGLLRRFDAQTVRAYLSFGLPLWGLGFLVTATDRATTFAISSLLGLTILGYIHIAQTLAARLSLVSQAVAGAIFPALRTAGTAPPDRLRSLIHQSNRLFAFGGLPLGTGLALFAADYVPRLFGPRWLPATPFVSIYCLAWGFGTIGYVSHLPFLALGETRSPGIYGAVTFTTTFAATVAAVLMFRVEGLLVAVGLSIFLAIAMRTLMLRRIVPSVSLLGDAARPACFTALGVAVVRGLEMTGGQWAQALPCRIAAFVAAVCFGAVLFDRETLRKVVAIVLAALTSDTRREMHDVSGTAVPVIDHRGHTC